MSLLKRAFIALVIVVSIFAFSVSVDTKTAQAAATANFTVSCSSVVLKITSAPAGTSYDLFVAVPGVGLFLAPPVPTVGGAVEIVVTFPAAPEGTFIYADTWQFSPFIPGFASINKRCGFEGPALPAGFVPAEITCDVTVFQVPNPDFQTSARLRKGQVWFVNPKPVPAQIDTFYKEWTEVFVSGPRNGFIPTACVRLISR